MARQAQLSGSRDALIDPALVGQPSLAAAQARLARAHAVGLDRLLQGAAMALFFMPLTTLRTGFRNAGLSESAALAQLHRLVDQQAFTRAADGIFLASAVIFVLLIGLVWLTRRPPRLARSPGSAAEYAGGAH